MMKTTCKHARFLFLSTSLFIALTTSSHAEDKLMLASAREMFAEHRYAAGLVPLQKAAEIVIYEFRAATLGRITLEKPEEFALWLAAGKLLDAERQVKKDKIETNRLIKFKKIPRPGRAESS